MRGVLSCVLFAPAVGALALAVAGRRAEKLATIAAAAALAAALPLWFLFVPRGPEWQFVEGVALAPAIGASYSLGIDGLSLVFVVLTAVAALIAASSMGSDRRTRYGSGLLLLETGVLGVFLSLDFLLFMASWSLAMAAAVSLLALSAAGRRITIALTVTTVVSGGLMLAGMLALHGHYHALSSIYSFDLRPYRQLTLPAALQLRVFLAFMPALVMAPLVCVLLARAAIATRPWMMVPALLVLNTGVYGVFRISLPMLPDASRTVLPPMLAVAILVAAAGAAIPLVQRDWRRSLTGATVAYVALATAGVFALTPDGLTGSIVQHVALALSLGALLLVEGRLRQFAGGPDGRAPGAAVPVLALLLLAAMLSLAGVPLLAGFVGLRRTVEGVWPVSRIAAAATVLLALTSAVAMWRAYKQRTGRIHGSADASSLPAVSVLEIALPAAFVGLSLWIGVQPAPLLERIETSVARVVMRVSPQHAAEVADCLTQTAAAPPPSTIPGLPVGMVLAAPCAEGSTTSPAAHGR